MSNQPDLNYINEMIKLCRKQGVKTIKIGDIELTLGDTIPAPAKPRGKSAKKANHGEQGEVESDGWENFSEEERLLWSTGGGAPAEEGTE